MLVRVLDGIRSEALGTKFESLYANGSTSLNDIWQARSRAYVHLYLKVMFGISDFERREVYVTDGSHDGGIDGYYIDSEARTIFLIQSKFRQTEENFENKPIELAEILSMQIKRVLAGEETDEDGQKYNGKIAGFQRGVSEIADLGRYKYRVIIIANIKNVSEQGLLRLTDGFGAEVVCYRRSYKELLFPVLAGAVFKATELNITLDLSNKTSGIKIGSSVCIDEYQCEITVVFAPTIEIARLMSCHKNYILKYNPRSYLEFYGQNVNEFIRETILETESNDFVLLNNGITIVCDQSGVSDQSGKKHTARLFLLNPQIINGGQTAYTLSRIYELLSEVERGAVFAGKEVLVKVIALTKKSDIPADEAKRIALIERISTATNSQTTVTLSDRASNDPLHTQIQSVLFERYGLLYERKRGEFSDGLKEGLIDERDIVDRVAFARIFLAASGTLNAASRKKITLAPLYPNVLDHKALDRFILAFHAFEFLRGSKSITSKKSYMSILPKVTAATLVACGLKGIEQQLCGQLAAKYVVDRWSSFLAYAISEGTKSVLTIVDEKTGTRTFALKEARRVFDSHSKNISKHFFLTRMTWNGISSREASLLLIRIWNRANRYR